MRKTMAIFALALFVLAAVSYVSAQPMRDIAVVGHRLNNTGNPGTTPAPNSTFTGWSGGNAGFNMFTTNPPNSYLVDKLNGSCFSKCTASLNIANAPAIADFSMIAPFGVDLHFSGQGTFSVSCLALPSNTTLTGTFSRAVLHAYNGSNSVAITLALNSVAYITPTNLITGGQNNYSLNNGTLSIAIITLNSVSVIPPTAGTPGSVSGFDAFSNVTFGAVKLP